MLKNYLITFRDETFEPLCALNIKIDISREELIKSFKDLLDDDKVKSLRLDTEYNCHIFPKAAMASLGSIDIDEVKDEENSSKVSHLNVVKKNKEEGQND